MLLSSRRYIKTEVFSSVVSAARLRQVQKILYTGKVGSPDIDGILCITGIDSHYNGCTYELLNYLLFDFFEVRKNELLRCGVTEEEIDDLMMLVGSDYVEIYCNPVSYYCLLPYVSHWPGLKFYCLSEEEYVGHEDASEEFKIRSLIAMVKNCQVIGFPFSGRGQSQLFDMMELEKWPIIQAFALDEFNGAGFFTMQHKVVDISQEVHSLVDHIDPVSVEKMLTERFPGIMRQWDNMMRYVQIALHSSSPVLSQKKVAEPLVSYFNHELVTCDESIEPGLFPFVVFGVDSARSKLQKVLAGEGVSLSDLKLTGGNPTHMICQFVSPHTSVICARTYLFCPESNLESAEKKAQSWKTSPEWSNLRYTTSVYLSLVKAALAAITSYTKTASTDQARETFLQTLTENCSQLQDSTLQDYLSSSSNIEFILDTLATRNRKTAATAELNDSLIKYISVTLYDLPAPGQNSPGSLVFAETFLTSRICRAGSADVSSDSLVVTSTVPRHQVWSPQASRTTEVPCLPADVWGELLMTRADVHLTRPWVALLAPETVKLTVWRNGLLVQSLDYGDFVLHGSSISSVSFYDGDSMSVVALLVLSVTQAEHLPPHLVADPDEEVNRVVLAFTPHSKSYTQLYQTILPSWRSGSQFPVVDLCSSLDPELQRVHSYLQNKLTVQTNETNSLTKPLTKLDWQMPGLIRFLEHLNNSCGLYGPLTDENFKTLTGSAEPSKPQADNKIVVTIIAGMPACGRKGLMSSLIAYGQSFINWEIYEQMEECQLDVASLHQSMSSVLESRNQWLTTKSTRFIIVAPGFCDTADIVRAIYYHPDHKLRSEFIIGSITVCIDPNNAFMEHRMTFPMLAGNCAAGWVNNIWLTSQTMCTNKTSECLEMLIRSINPTVHLLRPEKDIFKSSSSIDMLLSDTAFGDSSLERTRLLLKPFWREGYPHPWPCNPPMMDVLLRLTRPVCKQIFLSKLQALPESWTSFQLEGRIYLVHGTLIFSGSTTLVDIEFASVSGRLSLTSSNTDRIGSSGEGTASVLCFTGSGLKEQELKQLLNKCVQQKAEKKVFLTRQDLTNERISEIHRARHLDPLPEGWYYTGTKFVSMDGLRSQQHPNLEDFIQEYLAQTNREIQKFNEQIEADNPASLWQL